jgi:tetratricopeptide (TPR) repeat protein
VNTSNVSDKLKPGWIFYPAICISILLLAGPVFAQVHDPKALTADPVSATTPIAPVLKGLGDHHFEVTTTNPQSQYFFDQGYRLTLGFNHSEALRAFKEAARLDPDNAMAYWGWALVLGPNLNLPMQEGVVGQAFNAMQMAVKLKDQVSARERAYIEALAVRYTDDLKADRAPLDAAYAKTMAELVQQYPDDLDAATLYAAAIMNTNPWDYWYTDGSPKPNTELIVSTLQSVIDRDPRQAGAHHYLIHAVEAYRPELAIASADQLAALMPGAGHLVHMPSHIYMRVGRYADSYDVNVLAAEADKGYITQCRAQGLYPLAYYPHNLHFLVWSAMFQGRSKEATIAARQVADAIPAESKDNSWALYESFRSQPMFVMVRFGKWDEILAEPQPEKDARFMNGVWHYGRGMAATSQGMTTQAQKEFDQLTALRQQTDTDPSYISGFSAAGGLLRIAEEILAGEMAAKQGNYKTSISHLERAVRLEDGLLYNEPSDWYFPVRHVLGAVLLEAGFPAEAEVVYWEDLRRNPKNGYSLFGLEQSLQAQRKVDIARVANERFKRAWKDADVILATSRY